MQGDSATTATPGRLSDRAIQDDPFDYYQERLSKCPVWHEEDVDLYVIGGLSEARETLMNVDTFSSAPARKGASGSPVAVAYMKVLAEKGWARAVTLQRTDPPVHTRYRQILNRIFTPARVKQLTPHIEDITKDLIDRFADSGSCEFVADFALPLPGVFICEQLGLDRAQYRRFRRWAEAMLCLAQRPTMTMEEAMEEVEIEVEAQHYLANEMERRRSEPTDDLISLVVNAHKQGGDEPFTMNELQDLMHQLVTGGFETTTGALSAAMLLLVEHPDQQRLLRDNPGLMGNFIEEALRVDAPVQGLWRRAACPAEVHGMQIPEGASVMVRYGAANHDPRVFDEPQKFDIARENARNHVSFGFGNHFCIGAALARQQMTTAFTQLLERFEWIELAEPMPSPSHDASFFLRPLTKLPLKLTPRV
jgi:cytochrome P450